jgi:hypothetical protein
MRITLTIADDVLSAAREIAAAESRTLGQVISALARQGLASGASERPMRNGVPLLQVRSGAPPVTSELVRELQEELR